MKAKQTIPVHTLQDRNIYGLEIKKIESAEWEALISLRAAHRDDHYIFFFQEHGQGKLMVDFKEITVKGCSIFMIHPGQVHHGISTANSTAWFMAIDVSWISESFRVAFQASSVQNQPVSITEEDAVLLKGSLAIISALYNAAPKHFHHYTLRSAADVCISMFASFYHQQNTIIEKTDLRISMITRQFKSMLLKNFISIKSPAAYAAALHISTSYLNEAVKETTGFSVSYWIRQEVILEAKRMLFYTENTVKEIAHALGFQDATYFIRLFSKTAGISPLQFRQKHQV